MMKNEATHKFSKAGLGDAPFAVKGYKLMSYQAAQGAPIQAAGMCDYCGTCIMHAYVIKSADGKEFVVGSSCVYKTGDEGLIQTVRRQINAAERERRAVKRAERKAARDEQRKLDAVDQVAEILAEVDGLAEALEFDHAIVKDIKARLEKWGKISTKQIALVFKLASEPPKVEIEWQEVVEGRQALTGTVLATKWQESQYGGSLKMLVHLDGDQKVWGTVPASLFWTEEGEDLELRGVRIGFTATVTQSNDDAKFGFFKRPTKGKVL